MRLMLLEQPVTRANPWRCDSSPITRGHELFALVGMPEYVEDAWSGRNRRFANDLLNPVAQLLLLKELLKGLNPSDIAILEEIEFLEIQIRLQPGGDNQEPPSIVPRISQRVGTLLGALNHVYDVAQVDDIRLLALPFRAMRRVPSEGTYARLFEMPDIIAMTAAVIQYFGLLRYDPVVQCRPDWPGEIVATDCGAVPGDHGIKELTSLRRPSRPPDQISDVSYTLVRGQSADAAMQMKAELSGQNLLRGSKFVSPTSLFQETPVNFFIRPAEHLPRHFHRAVGWYFCRARRRWIGKGCAKRPAA